MTDPLAEFKDRFRIRAIADRAELEVLAQGDRNSADLRRLVHNLAGTAGTFGHAALSCAAIEVDDQMAAGQPANKASLERLKERLDEIAQSSA